jgi:hypothetical protein
MTTYTPATPRTLDEQAQSLIDSEIYCCQTSLVECLLKSNHDGFTIDAIQNFYFPAHLLSRVQLEQCHAERGLLIKQEQGETDADYLIRLQGEYNWQNEPQEIFEWHAVCAWLAVHLAAIGEPVLSNDYGNWWGRTATGQEILQDGVFQRIARRITVHLHIVCG